MRAKSLFLMNLETKQENTRLDTRNRSSLSAGHGSTYANVFGADVEYTRTIMTTDMKLPIAETSLVWYETKPVFKDDGSVDDNSADYEVSAPPANGLDVLVIALRKRKKNG